MIGEIRNARTIFVGKPSGICPLGKMRSVERWMELSQDRIWGSFSGVERLASANPALIVGS
jgi:hypothetical protein